MSSPVDPDSPSGEALNEVSEDKAGGSQAAASGEVSPPEPVNPEVEAVPAPEKAATPALHETSAPAPASAPETPAPGSEAPAPTEPESLSEEEIAAAAAAALTAAKARLREADKTGASVTGKVVAIVRGGYEVDVDGVICQCPFAQIDLTPPRDQLVHARQVYEFKVLSYKQRGRRITLSRRSIVQKEARKAERAAMARVKIGSEHDGVVASINDFGAFIDIDDGVQGMVHVSEITHARLAKPSDLLQVGGKVRVKVLKVDRRRGRLSLSMKALEGDPWAGISKKVQANQIIEGRILRLTEFGAFVEVAPGVDGLIHISEIPEGSKDAYTKLAAESTVVPVHVLRVEAAKKRISLAPAPDGMQAGDVVKMMDLRPGKDIEVTVDKIDKSGVIVKIGEAQSGLIPANESGTPRGADLAKAFSPGQKIRALVMRQERGDRRIRLSVRRAERRDERRQIEDYRKSSSSAAGSFATLGDFFKPKTGN